MPWKHKAMENKTVLITGATSGIGEACARQLSSLGDTCILLGRNKDKLDILKRELGDKGIPYSYDLRDLDHIKDIFEYCKEKGFKLDGLIHSAGVNADCPVKVNNRQLMMEAMTVHCFAFAELGKYFISKRYSNDGAAIVAISSIASLNCDRGMAPYSASKAALNAYVKTMSKEFLRRGIRVNAILPGGVNTPMAEKKGQVLGTALDQQKEEAQPLGGIEALAIAKEAVHLLSRDSRYTTGSLLTISGGRDF